MTITALPTPPTRQDPNNFAARADALMAALPTFVSECNATATTVDANNTAAGTSASTAITKAGEAAAARDIAMAAVSYKGLWSSLSGALNIPASVYHSGSIWMLTQSVASVGAETPGVSSKWINVTPASGLGSAAYQPSSAFQPAIGALTGLLKSGGSGTISAATAADIVAAIGSTSVANATNATNATSASTASSIIDGAVSTAAKIANAIISWAKVVNIPTGRILGRGSAGVGSVEELTVGTGLDISGGSLVCTVTSPVASVGGNIGTVTNAQLAASVNSANAVSPGTKYYSNIAASNPSTASASPVELANVVCHLSGTVRIYTSGGSTGGAQWGSFTVYKNGVAAGAGFSINTSSSRTDDISVSSGDTLQVFASVTNGGTAMLTGFNIGVSSQAKVAPFTPISIGDR